MTTKKQINDVLTRCKGGVHNRKDKRSTRAKQKQQQIKDNKNGTTDF